MVTKTTGMVVVAAFAAFAAGVAKDQLRLADADQVGREGRNRS